MSVDPLLKVAMTKLGKFLQGVLSDKGFILIVLGDNEKFFISNESEQSVVDELKEAAETISKVGLCNDMDTIGTA